MSLLVGHHCGKPVRGNIIKTENIILGTEHDQLVSYVSTITHALSSCIMYTVDKLHSMYCDLLKRLDDSSDEVRIALTRTLEAYTE